MRRIWNKNVAAGGIMGAIAAALTFNIARLAMHPAALVVRWIEAMAFTLALPGVFVEFFAARAGHSFPIWLAAICNFIFWFGFAWLFGVLVDRLRQQIRLLASHF